MVLKLRVLGSGAGGGFPQWNCNCDNCSRLRAGTLSAQPLTQSSIALSGNGGDWLLVNASPDIRQQILAFPALQSGGAKRDTGIRAVLPIDSQIDHTTCLLMPREHHALAVLQFKLDVLWSMLDAMYMAYIMKMSPYINEGDVP